MTIVLLLIHIMIALALIAVVLLQRSEGGALGIGGGGGGFMTGRGAANFLTRVTAGLAAAFFFTSLVLSLLATQPATSILDQQPGLPGTNQPSQGPRKPSTAPPTSLPPIDLSKTDPGGKGLPEEGAPKVPQSK